MIRSIFLSAFMFLLFSIESFGQQQLQYTQFAMNKYAYHPAYAGLENSLSLTAVYRSQWSGLNGNPNSQHVNAHIPLYYLNGAAGLKIQNDSYGGLSQTHVDLSYSYILDNTFGLLAIAGKAGLTNLRLNGSDIITPDGSYEGPIITHNDPILGTAGISGSALSFGAGAYFLHRYFEVGMSYDQISKSRIALEEANLQMENQFNFIFEFKYRLNSQWAVFPSFQTKTDTKEWQNELMVLAKYNGNIFGGIGMRGFSEQSLDALTFLIGTSFNRNIKLSYSYDAGLSSLKRANEGSHEILLNYNLNKLIGVGQKQKIIYNPRYL